MKKLVALTMCCAVLATSVIANAGNSIENKKDQKQMTLKSASTQTDGKVIRLARGGESQRR